MTGLEWHVTGASAHSSQNFSHSTLLLFLLLLLLLILLRKQARQPLLFTSTFSGQANRDAMGRPRLLGPAWSLTPCNKHSQSPLWGPAAASHQLNLLDFAACLLASVREPVKLPRAGEDRQKGVVQHGIPVVPIVEREKEKKIKRLRKQLQAGLRLQNNDDEDQARLWSFVGDRLSLSWNHYTAISFQALTRRHVSLSFPTDGASDPQRHRSGDWRVKIH